jgi:hypothetical protein
VISWLKRVWRQLRHPEEYPEQRLRRQWLEDLKRHNL